jgi:GH25 family lysozyme M1 (1,4-beta-N-acetylmuramidase)
MATKLLDISFWQDTLDFTKIKKAGYNNIILRAGYGTTIDSKFNEYATACKKNNINIVAVYWFIYATNLTDVKANANKCLEVIKAYKPKIVFADFEYDTITKAAKKGVKLSAKECNSFTIKFCETVKKAGYIPGYYANTDYYNNMYSSAVKNKGYVFWLAHYKSDYSYHEPPIKCDFFQYTDRGTVPGLTGKKFDTNVCFSEKYLSKTSTTSTNKPTTKPTTSSITIDKAIDALIATAQAEIGYMEKKSNAQLDDKTANVGDGNYTKYWRDLKPSWNGSAWCAVWVSWCMYKTFGLETAKKLLKHENDFPYVYCPTLGARFTKYANPQRGDIVIFYRNGTFTHTGIVTKVEGDKFYTIEGNTSNGSTIIANGGEVCFKHYNNSNLPGTKFCRPDYSIVKSIMSSSSTSKPSTTTYKKWVGAATKDDTDVFANPTGTSKLSTYQKLNKGNLVDVIGVSGTRYQVKIADKFVGYVEKTNIKDPNAVVVKPSASTSKTKYPFVGEVTASELNVRTGAGTNYSKLSSYPILKRGNLVDVLKAKKDTSGNKWYQVRIAGKYTGYVSAQYIKKK